MGKGDVETRKTGTFTFRELAIATNNFRQESLLGEGGFGTVYKGKIGDQVNLFTLSNPSVVLETFCCGNCSLGFYWMHFHSF